MRFPVFALALFSAPSAFAHEGPHPSPFGHDILVPGLLLAAGLVVLAVAILRSRGRDAKVKADKSKRYGEGK